MVTVPQKCVAHSAPGAAKLDAAKQNLAKVILRRSYIRCDYWAILENRMGAESNGVTLLWTVISTRLEISFVFVMKNYALAACDRSVCYDSKVPSSDVLVPLLNLLALSTTLANRFDGEILESIVDCL